MGSNALLTKVTGTTVTWCEFSSQYLLQRKNRNFWADLLAKILPRCLDQILVSSFPIWNSILHSHDMSKNRGVVSADIFPIKTSRGAPASMISIRDNQVIVLSANRSQADTVQHPKAYQFIFQSMIYKMRLNSQHQVTSNCRSVSVQFNGFTLLTFSGQRYEKQSDHSLSRYARC